MAETRESRQLKAPSHYTRLQGRRGNVEVKSDKSLLVVRDQKQYEGTQAVFDKMKGFQLKAIDVPTASRQDAALPKGQENMSRMATAATDNQPIDPNRAPDAPMADETKIKVGVQEENSAQETFASNNVTVECQSSKPSKQDIITDLQKFNSDKISGMIHRDYNDYANKKLEIPAKLFNYPKVIFPGTNKVVPDFYIKFVEPTNHEIQNTVEKCWSFKDKMYECTQQKIQELKDANIEISPNDFEWVIDHFEKSAINNKRQGVRDLIKSFRDEFKGPCEDVQLRVSDKTMEEVYRIWKFQRENRKNRSFIRYFWHYQDSVGEDNYQTFQINQMKNKTSLRGSIKQKMNGYAGAFIERENAVILSDMISHIHQKTLLTLDVYKLQDDQFDKLLKIDKQSSDQDGSTRAVSLLDENEEQDNYKHPFLTKAEELELLEHDQQTSLQTQSIFMTKDKYQESTLQPCVDTHRDIHQDLFTYSQFPIPENPTKGPKGNKLNKTQQMSRPLNNNMYEHEFMELDPQSYQASITAQERAIKQAQMDIKNLNKKNFNDDTSANHKDISRSHSARGLNEESMDDGLSENQNEEPSKPVNLKPRKPNKKLLKEHEEKKEKDSAHDSVMSEKPIDDDIVKPDLVDTKLEKKDIKKKGRKPNIKLELKVEIKGDTGAIDKVQTDDDAQQEEPVKQQSNQDGDFQTHQDETRQQNKTVHVEKEQINPIPQKKTKKQRKNQIVGFNTIKLITMMMHHQKQDLNMKLTPDEVIEKSVPINYQRQLDLCFQNNYKPAQGEMERIRSLNPAEMNDQNQNAYKTIKLQKKIRRIVQDVKINNETSELMFDFMKQREPELDIYECRYVESKGRVDDNKVSDIEKQNQLLKEKTAKKEKQLLQLNKEFEQMKNRQFQVRRGRNNRIFYKSMAKTVFDYDSDDYMLYENGKNEDKSRKWNHDNRECGRKRQRHPDNSCAKQVDRYMMNQKTLIEDIQKHCKNKRLKKNILKMNGIRLMSNGTKQQIEQPQFTNASSDFEKMPRTINDPIIENVFKKTHYEQYNELMSSKATESLMRKGIIPENVFENESIQQKLDDYDEFLQARKTQVCTPTNSEQKRHQAESNLKKLKQDEFDQRQKQMQYGNLYNGFNGVTEGMDTSQQFLNGFNSNQGTLATLAGSPSATLNVDVRDTNEQQDQFKLSYDERQSILQNLHFQKTFNKSVSVYKQQMQSDFQHFKSHVQQQKQYQISKQNEQNTHNQNPMNLFSSQQLFAFNQQQQQQYIQQNNLQKEKILQN